MAQKVLEQVIFICKESGGINIKYLSEPGVLGGLQPIVLNRFFNLKIYEISTDDIGILLRDKGYPAEVFIPYSAILEISPRKGGGLKKELKEKEETLKEMEKQ